MDGCNKCILNENKQQICLSCNSHYADLLNINGTCNYCENINDIGGNGYKRCGYNNYTLKYECYECYDYYYRNYTLISNDKKCVHSSEVHLSIEWLEVINIGNLENPIYSCNNCSKYTAKITNSTNNITDCYNRIDELVYCLEGVSNNISKECTSCVEHSQLNNNNICECDSDSFSKNNLFCYLCDDNNQGNPGCNVSKGCEYRNNDQLNCKECKSGYFEYTAGQCFSCSKEIEFCNICKIDSNDQLFCEECIGNFTYNNETKKCEKDWEENNNIASGCINFDGINKENGKCQICKSNYFKTKNDLCIYCNQESYGGTYCDKCEYNTDGNVICSECYGIKNSKGKCYNCEIDLFDECENCKFILNNGVENLACTLCKPGYYLENGNCINYLDKIKNIPHCTSYSYLIGNISFDYYPKDEYAYW